MKPRPRTTEVDARRGRHLRPGRFTALLLGLLAMGCQSVPRLNATELKVFIESIDPASGEVTLNGVAARRPTGGFLIHWGDCDQDIMSFPADHTYGDKGRNYEIRVVAAYPDGGTGQAWTVARFVPPTSAPDLTVELPATTPALFDSLDCQAIGNLVPLPDAALGGIPRDEVASVLTRAAEIQWGFMNGDVYLWDGVFRQLVLGDPQAGGFYTLWYSTPLAVAGNPRQTSFPWVPFFHEMGHNFALNSPARFRVGGKTDGRANAILTETVAYILERATAKVLLQDGGLSRQVREAIMASMDTELHGASDGWGRYLECLCLGCTPPSGRQSCFESWNADEGADSDETVPTFMTLAWEFIRRTEQGGHDYRETVSRMMALLQTFDADLLGSYSPGCDSDRAEELRATLMVAALSHGLQEDLRPYFTGLQFPLDGNLHDELLERVGG